MQQQLQVLWCCCHQGAYCTHVATAIAASLLMPAPLNCCPNNLILLMLLLCSKLFAAMPYPGTIMMLLQSLCVIMLLALVAANWLLPFSLSTSKELQTGVYQLTLICSPQKLLVFRDGSQQNFVHLPENNPFYEELFLFIEKNTPSCQGTSMSCSWNIWKGISELHWQEMNRIDNTNSKSALAK